MLLFHLFELPLLAFLHLLLVPVVRRRCRRIVVPLVARIIRLLVPWIVVLLGRRSVVPRISLVSLFQFLLLLHLLLLDFLTLAILLLAQIVEFLLMLLFELRIHLRPRSRRTVVVSVWISPVAAIIATVFAVVVLNVVVRDRRRTIGIPLLLRRTVLVYLIRLIRLICLILLVHLILISRIHLIRTILHRIAAIVLRRHLTRWRSNVHVRPIGLRLQFALLRDRDWASAVCLNRLLLLRKGRRGRRRSRLRYYRT